MKSFDFLLFLVACTNLSAWERVTLTFGGDIMAHDVNYRMADYNHIYDDVRSWLYDDDLSFANLEFPIDDTRPYSTYPLFNVNTPYVLAAIRGGFEAFSLANNHSNDQGRTGMVNTLAATQKLARVHGALFNGLKRGDQSDWEVSITTVNGVRVGLLSVTNLLNSSTASEMIHFSGWLETFRRLIDPPKTDQLLRRVQEAARQVDILVLSLHDGLEYQKSPMQEQLDLYPRLCQAGARVVWVHHPHVLNPYQRVGQRLILYSMGNFISGQRHMLRPNDFNEYRAERGDGALVRVQFVRHDDGLWRMLEPRVQFITHYNEEGRGWGVRRLPQLLTELAPDNPWLAYYRHRYQEMQRRFQPLVPRWIWQDLELPRHGIDRFRRLGPLG